VGIGVNPEGTLADMYPDLWKQARALVILKIIFDTGRPLQVGELVAATQADKQTILKYCNTLATMGLVTRVRSHAGFALTAQGFAFLSPNHRANMPGMGERQAEYPAKTAKNPLFAAHNPPYLAKDPLNSAENPPNLANYGRLINTTTTSDAPEEVVVGINSAKSAFFGENLDFFEEIGITLNPQTEFLANHVEPDKFRREWEKLIDKGKPWPGLLIRILTHRPRPRNDSERSEADRRRRQRYAQWDTQR
jgi:predicted transcriptional regulator